jgi:DNA polymerase III epsilon subunit-like protein
MTILVIDCETTSDNPKTGRIIQLAAQLYSNGELKQQFNEKIKQDPQESNFSIDLGAMKVNKTKLSQLKCNTNPEWKVVEMFVDWLLVINEQYSNIQLLGHNFSGFDLQFIKEMFERNSVVGLNSVLPHRVLDTSAIGLFLNSIGVLNIEKFNSTNLFKELGVNVKKEDLHDALVDCSATYSAFLKMQELVKGNNHIRKSAFEDLVSLTKDPMALRTKSTSEFESLTTEPVMPIKEVVNN